MTTPARTIQVDPVTRIEGHGKVTIELDENGGVSDAYLQVVEFRPGVTVPEGTFTDVAGGEVHSLGLRTDGTLAGWGWNYYGQATVPAGTFTDVAGGGSHSLGVRTDGTLAGWGWNGSGQVTVPSGTFTDVAGGGYHSLGVRTDGTLAGWGNNEFGQTTVPAGAFTDVAGGRYHSLGVRTDGTLAGWGRNRDGETTVPAGTFVAVEAGYEYGLALRARTSYDDLVVNGNGLTDVASWFNRSVTVAGSATIQSMMVTANNPTMTVNDQITLESGGGIEGTGNFLGRFEGQAGSSITPTGPMLLGAIASADGFVHNGALSVGAQNVLLMDADHAILGGQTTMAGGQLGSFAGITLASGGSIEGYGSIHNNFTNQGVVTGSGGDLILPGVIDGDGDFLGTVRFSGLYSPGLSPASVTLGDPIFENTLKMELGGLTAGFEYDHIDITGTATLGGMLDVVTINDFLPDLGDYFDLFDGTLSGTFASVSLPTLTPGLFWDQSGLYTSGVLSVYSSGPAPIPVPGAAALVLFGLTLVTGWRRRGS